MDRMKLAGMVLAALLVLASPFQQAQCACMAASHASAPMSACHEGCCESAAAPQCGHESHSCQHLAIRDLPVVPALSVAVQPVVAYAALPATQLVEPSSATPEIIPALDVGSPPLPVDVGAHDLRAPPLSF